jgi:hypothetical protein
LEGSEAINVLGAIWKESHYVTKDALNRAGMTRISDANEELSQLGLAHSFPETNSGRSMIAAYGRIRLVIIAASAYGLIERKEVSRVKTQIAGTTLLHRFMVELGQAQLKEIRRILLFARGPDAELLNGTRGPARRDDMPMENSDAQWPSELPSGRRVLREEYRKR